MAGRPKGSTTRPQMRNFINDKKVKELVKKAEEMAKNGDSTMLKFVLEQIFGKAVQPIGGDKDNPFVIAGFNFVRNDGAKTNNKTDK